jgi:hypothetical protein
MFETSERTGAPYGARMRSLLLRMPHCISQTNLLVALLITLHTAQPGISFICVTFEVFTANMKMAVYRQAAPCSLVDTE